VSKKIGVDPTGENGSKERGTVVLHRVHKAASFVMAVWTRLVSMQLGDGILSAIYAIKRLEELQR
jgi:hypothetical protein